MYTFKTYLFENWTNPRFSVTSDATQWEESFCHRLLGNVVKLRTPSQDQCLNV